jgi:hypothetical protein
VAAPPVRAPPAEARACPFREHPVAVVEPDARRPRAPEGQRDARPSEEAEVVPIRAARHLHAAEAAVESIRPVPRREQEHPFYPAASAADPCARAQTLAARKHDLRRRLQQPAQSRW